ncbi:MAG: helix-turn-helix domain-containing protein [Saprospiraceae bacterium]|nr:helix-turn-helix domain-containing protein [Saprospiraceae bacterium]
MNIITIEEEAFFKLIETTLQKLNINAVPDRWINQEEAMRLLNIKSKTTLQKLRDEGKVRFSQPISQKTILYDRNSILELIEKHAKKPFHGR